MSGRLPNLLLIGPGRTATTSLFRTLARHPEICVSKKKEVDRYRNVIFGRELGPFDEYTTYFEHCSNHPVVMEATPGYFFGGARLASTAKRELGAVKVIVVLREPLERAYSLYQHVRNKQQLSMDEDFDEYLDACGKYEFGSQYSEANIRYSCLLESLYGRLIREWESVVRPENLHMIDFNQIEGSSRRMVTDILDFLGVTKDLPLELMRENRSQEPRLPGLHKMVLAANAKLEWFFTKHPNVKNYLRAIYSVANTKKGNTVSLDQFKPFFVDFYRRDYAVLGEILRERNLRVGWLGEYV